MKGFKGMRVPRDIPRALRTLLREHDRQLVQLDEQLPAAVGQLEDGSNTTGRGNITYKSFRGGRLPALEVAAAGEVLEIHFQNAGTVESNRTVELKEDFTYRKDDMLRLVSTGRKWIEAGRTRRLTRLECPIVINEDGDPCQPVVRIESDTLTDLVHIDGLLEAVGFNSQPVTSSATAGGLVQLFPDFASGANTDQKTKGLYIRTNATVSGVAADLSVFRALHIDMDVDLDNSGNFLVTSFQPFDMDFNVTHTAGTNLISTCQPFSVYLETDGVVEFGGVSPTDSAVVFQVVSPVTGAGPGNGYIGYLIQNNAGPSSTQIGVGYRMECGGSGDQIILNAAAVVTSGATGDIIANRVQILPRAGLTSLTAYQSNILAGGANPSRDVMMSFFGGSGHILCNDSIIAEGGVATPATCSAGHLDFTTGALGNIYAADDLEVDGKAWFDGDIEWNDAQVTGQVAAWHGDVLADLLHVESTNDTVGIGTSAPESRLDVNGSFGVATTAIDDTDSPYTALISDSTILCDCTNGTITVNLPAAASCEGRIYNIKKIDSSGNAVTVDGSGAETIDDSATLSISAQYESYTIQSDGTEWWIL